MKYSLIFILTSFFSFLCGDEFRVITTEYSSKLGMFAAANQVLGQLYLFETGQLPNVSGLTIDFDTHGLYYDPSCGSNWWTYYFEPLCIGESENANIVYPTEEQYREAWIQRRMIPRETAAQLIKKYIHIKSPIQRKIDAFVDQFFLNKYVIGIHYRGTDKNKEAPRIAYETLFEEVEQNAPKEKPYVLFIATDEVDFLEQAREKYPGCVVAIEAHRSESAGLGVHFINKNNYILGEEALTDAVLLSKCDLLIRTSSNLSLWSTYFNPNLPVILLNQRYLETLEPE
jgi:hypothetical protein